MTVKYRVCIIEYERGWGHRREYEYFDTVEKAIQYRDHINLANKPLTKGESVPDWYMTAEKEIKIVEDL